MFCSYGLAYTMPASPRGASNAYLGLVPSKNRSLRGGVVVRNGGAAATGLGGKGMSMPGTGVIRSSSTLPRMSARQLQQPIPSNVPSFLRPNSSINFPSAPVAPTASSPLVTQAQSFQPLPHHHLLSSQQQLPVAHTALSSSSCIVAPKSCDMDDVYMDELCKSITDHVLPDGELRTRARW